MPLALPTISTLESRSNKEEPNEVRIIRKGFGKTLQSALFASFLGAPAVAQNKLAPGPKGKWKYTVLHTFDGSDGALPEGNLVLDSKGNLYGGTVVGGSGYGVVFELTP